MMPLRGRKPENGKLAFFMLAEKSLPVRRSRPRESVRTADMSELVRKRRSKSARAGAPPVSQAVRAARSSTSMRRRKGDRQRFMSSADIKTAPKKLITDVARNHNRIL